MKLKSLWPVGAPRLVRLVSSLSRKDSVLVGGVPQTLVEVEVVRSKNGGDGHETLGKMLHRLWVGLRQLRPVHSMPNHHETAGSVSLVRSEPDQIHQRSVDDLLSETLALGGIDGQPEFSGQRVLDGGVVRRHLKTTPAEMRDEQLGLDGSGSRIGKRLCMCPVDHGGSKTEMVGCSLRMLGIFLPNVRCAPTGAIERRKK